MDTLSQLHTSAEATNSGSPHAPALIKTKGLVRTFKSRKGTVEAVRGVDLEVREGEIFGFLGPNGAGKTTTMRILTTLMPASGGTATVCGLDLRRDPGKVRRQIGYVSQVGGAEPIETGRENLLLQGRVYGMSAKEARQRAKELVTRLDMDDFADRLVKTYSGGQKRRSTIRWEESIGSLTYSHHIRIQNILQAIRQIAAVCWQKPDWFSATSQA